MSWLTLVIFLTGLVIPAATEKIVFSLLGNTGQSCRDACITMQASCDMSQFLVQEERELRNTLVNMTANCIYDDRAWWSFEQPCIVVDPFNGNFGRCLGWRGKPDYYDCSARHPHVRRLCQCTRDLACQRKAFRYNAA